MTPDPPTICAGNFSGATPVDHLDVQLVHRRRQPLGQPSRVREHDRRAVLQHRLDDGPVDVRPDRPGALQRRSRRARPAPASPARRSARRARSCPRPARTTRRSNVFAAGGCTISTGTCPPRNRATSSIGRTVADSPMRCAGFSRYASSRSSDTARCAPRFVAATAWISSTITVSTPASVSRAALVSIRYSDSGVVIRMSGGSRCSSRRSALVVSPERTPTVIGGHLGSEPLRGLRDADERRPQVALDVDPERLQRRDVEHAGAVPRILGPRRRRQPVERPEERRQRLARAGRRDDEGVLAPTRSPARPRPARASARGTRPRTTPASPGRSARGRGPSAYLPRDPRQRAGLPLTVAPGGTSCKTTLPMPTTAPAPTVTRCFTVAPAPM